MIDTDALLKDLQGELGRFTTDLAARVAEDDDVRGRLDTEWRTAFDAKRTGRTFEDWSDDRLTQVAVAWILACVFVRFGEDNGLIDEARIAGPALRGREARDAQQRYFTEPRIRTTASTCTACSGPPPICEVSMASWVRVTARCGWLTHPPMPPPGC